MRAAGVTDEHELRPGGFDVGDDPVEVPVGGHSGLVEDQHRLRVEGDLVVVEAPQERGDGAGLDVGFVAEGAGGLAGGGGAEHAVAVSAEGGAGRVEGGGLAGAGDTDDDLDGPPRGPRRRRGDR